MMNSIPQVPLPRNEPVLGYAPGSPERAELKAGLKVMAAEQIEIPLIIGGKEVRTGRTDTQVMPHDHGHVLATYHQAGQAEVRQAVKAALEAQREWAAWPWEDRLAVFLRAADLLATSWRPVLNGATMLGQSKTAHQAEIDAACELIDFYRFNAAYAQKLYTEQPLSPAGQWNRLDHRPLEGFVYAVTPFNFTSIAGNLPTAPAMLGNVVIWKPAASTVYSGWYIMRLLMEAGL
ncbi:MAG TPA: aldehyde dehydrogenase family protein, partial [Longimicrobiaceae bacterium]